MKILLFGFACLLCACSGPQPLTIRGSVASCAGDMDTVTIEDERGVFRTYTFRQNRPECGLFAKGGTWEFIGEMDGGEFKLHSFRRIR